MSHVDKRHRKHTSGRYVSFDKENQCWVARARFGQRVFYVGRFDSEATAKRRVNAFDLHDGAQ